MGVYYADKCVVTVFSVVAEVVFVGRRRFLFIVAFRVDFGEERVSVVFVFFVGTGGLG